MGNLNGMRHNPITPEDTPDRGKNVKAMKESSKRGSKSTYDTAVHIKYKR